MQRAKYIVLLGPDGSGKTALADALAAGLIAEGQVVSRLNFSFGIMPPLSRVLGRGKREISEVGLRDSGMVEPLRLGRVVILACWYGVDHLMGRWRLWRGPKGEVVIFARSYHDFLYQRAYLYLPIAIPRFFLALGPKPDLLASPLRDPKVIHDQKPELTEAEIADQYWRLEDRLERCRYFVRIDAADGIVPTVARLREMAAL